MTDFLDRRIRGLVAELVDAAPVPPPFGPVPSPTPRRQARRAMAVAAAAACLAVAAGLLVQVGGDEGKRLELGGRPPAPPAAGDVAKPTFVVPSQLPAGFALVGAGSDTSDRMGGQEIVFWSEDFTSSGSISWGGPDRRCPPAATPRWAGAAPQHEAIDAYRSGARTTPPPESLAWCDPVDHGVVSLFARGLSREAIADLAEGVVRNGYDLAVSLPPGFTAVRTPDDVALVKLLYRGPGPTDLWVSVRSAGPFALERRRLMSENPASWEPVTVGGRPGIQAGHFVSVLYDEHTLVDVYSFSVTVEDGDLLAAAGSLVPGDPTVAKPTASDRSLCTRLEMC